MNNERLCDHTLVMCSILVRLCVAFLLEEKLGCQNNSNYPSKMKVSHGGGAIVGQTSLW